jgi:DNA-binding transcriptional MocR family regulator
MEVATKPDYKYAEVADRIETLIENGVLKLGDRLLSVRALSKEQGISLSTAFQAYYALESKGLIEARPQSGYYVKFAPRLFPQLPTVSEPPQDAVEVTVDDVINTVYRKLNLSGITNFALAVPSIELLPAAKLNKSVLQAIRDSPTSCLLYSEIQGNELLRKQIARQAFNWGGTFTEDDIVVTAGCMEAIALSLKTVTKRGDAVAIESPTYFAFFQVMESLGLKVVELPTSPVDGIDLNYLEDAIRRFNIRACLLVPNFNNPMGTRMPDDSKKRLVNLLAKEEIPLIEDDIYGELYFGKTRPKTCKSFDKKGLVLHCSSFSKSLAPGYRIGYTIPGRFKEQFIRLKRMHTVSTNTLSQAAIAHFLSVGRYELHLRHLRKALHTQVLRYTQAVSEHFPADMRMTRPEGGFALWIELNKKVDALKLHKRAMKYNIGFAPGQMFSSNMRFENYLRISCGDPWNEKIEDAIRTLGKLAKEMSKG